MSSKETIATVTPIKFLRHHQGHGHLDLKIPGCGEMYNKPNCFVLQYKDQLIAVVLPVSATTKRLRSIGPFRVYVLSYLSGEINEHPRKLNRAFTRSVSCTSGWQWSFGQVVDYRVCRFQLTFSHQLYVIQSIREKCWAFHISHMHPHWWPQPDKLPTFFHRVYRSLWTPKANNEN